MTIINLVQNNHTPRQAGNSITNIESRLSFRLLRHWVDILCRLQKESSEAIQRLQIKLSSEEQEKCLAELACLQQETTTALQRMTALLNDEDKTGHTDRLPLPYARDWVWLSFRYFFESFNPEMALFQLWTLVRPVLTADGPTEQEREEAASFYELGSLLIEAAWELHRQQHERSMGNTQSAMDNV